MKKFTSKFNIVLSIFLLAGITFSVVQLVRAAALNPGHAWADLDDEAVPVTNGGTGQTTANPAFNALSPMTTLGDIIYGGVSGAGTRLASVAAGSYLRSGGVGTAPVWSTPTLPNTATNLKLMIGNATNWVESTPAYPNAAVTARKVIVSDGTNYIASTETWDVPGATAGNTLRSDGTNWVSTAVTTAQSTPADPTGTTNTSGLMMGLAGSITPVRSGKILINIDAELGVATANTAGQINQVRIRYGTGSAPANAAALTGTTVGRIAKLTNASTVSRAGVAVTAVVTGLTVNTAYWIDVSLASGNAGVTSLYNVGISVVEL